MREPWRARAAAQAQWRAIFKDNAAKKDTPDLIDSRTIGGVTVDLMVTPPAFQITDYLTMTGALVTALPASTSLYALRAVDDPNDPSSPISETKFRMVTWPKDSALDAASPDADPELVALAAECHITDLLAYDPAMPLAASAELITTSDSPALGWCPPMPNPPSPGAAP